MSEKVWCGATRYLRTLKIDSKTRSVFPRQIKNERTTWNAWIAVTKQYVALTGHVI